MMYSQETVGRTGRERREVKMTVEIQVRWNQVEGMYVGYVTGKSGDWVRIVSAHTIPDCADSARIYCGAHYVRVVGPER
jgi:hypothetical protein